jgi:spore germination cell wall hydrolase CwlJ-like protein
MKPIPPPGKRARRPQSNIDWLIFLLIVMMLALGMFLGYTFRGMTAQAAEPIEVTPTNRTAPLQEIDAPIVRTPGPTEEPEEPEPYYALTDSERYEIEQVVMAEAGGEAYDGQVAVAQCIRDTAIRDKLRPSEVIVEYKYTPTRKEPTQSVREAVSAVFDDGESVIDTAYYFYAPALVTSKWHESMEFVAELGGHRFFR